MEENKKMKYLFAIIILFILLMFIVIAIIKDLTRAPYDKPTIPEGFYYVTGEWNTGYVISDSKEDENKPYSKNGNQFVWIPVKDEKSFKRTMSFGTEIVEPNSNYIEPNSDDTMYQEMFDSVKKYGGFYVGRYETGDGDATENRTEATDMHNIVVKENQVVYNYVPWESAVSLAKSMYTNSSSVKSTLVYGIQWDAIMKFVAEDVDLNNSNFWGNYKDSVENSEENSGTLQKTGTSEYWKAKNIYDLAGNVGEWTMESNSKTIKIIRGGAYNQKGGEGEYSVAGRYDNFPSNANSNVGFRIALYLK